ncbi:hypothetical protein OEA41_004187 [Lepraria neglecta]|uniref:Uncharacterized protein n=1 Tax=Lepraria neglecta TaxID=209136 RepID=A0AAD9Z969_9LECA|nr:hypothetical protein OEA41_004187 [Lepraria neglecta]
MCALDMVMLSFFNSRERERDDWERIFQEVDKRFRFVGAWVPEGAALGIIEAVWEAETVNEVNGVNEVNEVNKAKEMIEFMEVDGVNEINGIKKVHGVIEVKEVREVNGSNGH